MTKKGDTKMFCYKCGSQVPSDNNFCAYCGSARPIAEQAVTVQEQTQYPPPQTDTPQAYSPPPQTDTWQMNTSQPQTDTWQMSAPQQQTDSWQTYSPPTQQADVWQTYAQPQPTDTYPQGEAEQSVPSKKNGKLWWKIAVPAALVVVAVAAVYYFLILGSPADTVSLALANLGEEVSQRIDGTPLTAFGKLAEVMEDGTLTVSFDYRDSWNDDRVNGDIILSSNGEQGEYALGGDITMYDGYWGEEQRIEFEAFINDERIAIGSKLFDNNYYGVRFSTFKDDIKVFGDMVGMDQYTMDSITRIFDMIENTMGNDSYGFDSLDMERYSELLNTFYERCEQTSERVDIDSGGNSVKATKIDIVATKDAIMGLLEDLYDLIEEDDDLRAVIKQAFVGSMGASMFYVIAPDSLQDIDDYFNESYNDMLRELRGAIRDFDRIYSDTSTITLSLFIGNGNRMLRIELDMNIRIDGERIRFNASFDFGESVNDRWVFRFNANGTTGKITWDYKERSNSIENTLTISDDDFSVTLRSDWSPTKGDFTLSFEQDDAWWGPQRGEFSGNYIQDNNGFKLSFEIPSGYYDDDNISIRITGERGANIKQISYINIDKWDWDLINRLEEFFAYGLSGSLGGQTFYY